MLRDEREDGSRQRVIHPLTDYQTALAELKKTMQPFLETLPGDAAHAEVLTQFEEGCQTFEEDVDAFLNAAVRKPPSGKKKPGIILQVPPFAKGVRGIFPLVPKLRLGNLSREAPASRHLSKPSKDLPRWPRPAATSSSRPISSTSLPAA